MFSMNAIGHRLSTQIDYICNHRSSCTCNHNDFNPLGSSFCYHRGLHLCANISKPIEIPLMADDDASSVDVSFSIENAICVKGGGLRHRAVIPQRHFHYDGDICYMHCSTTLRFLAQIVFGEREFKGLSSRHIFSHTDVFLQIWHSRNSKLTQLMLEMAGPENKCVELNIFEYLRISQHVVDAPSIGDVSGIPMRVRLTSRKAPLYVELTANNVMYLRAACQAQLEMDSIKRNVLPKKKTNKDNVVASSSAIHACAGEGDLSLGSCVGEGIAARGDCNVEAPSLCDGRDCEQATDTPASKRSLVEKSDETPCIKQARLQKRDIRSFFKPILTPNI